MSKDQMIWTRIDENKKKKFESVVSSMGLTTSQAIRMFMNQTILEQAIPFKLRIPNEQTLQAIEEVRSSKKLKRYKTTAEMKKALES